MNANRWYDPEDESNIMRETHMKKAPSKYLKLFLSTFYLSAFTFGGGYVIVTLLKQKFVDELHWIDEEEMLDMVAIAQSSPGAIAVNGAIVVGYKIGGIPGVLISVLGAVIPHFIIITAISFFYNAFRDNFIIHAVLKGMKSGVCAVIFSVVFDMAANIVRKHEPVQILIMVAAFVADYIFDVNVVVLVILTALLGAVLTICRERRNRRRIG